jgi:Tol biopolymer transport system component
MARDRAVLLVLAAALGGCSGDEPNPFADIIQTFAPSSAASIVFTSNGYGQVPGAPREIFSIETSGAGLTRLTFCNVEPRRCDTALASSAPDRQRMAILRVVDDTDGDGRLTEADGQALLVTDLSRAVEGPLFPQSQLISGVDWSAGGDVLVYNGVGEGGIDDLFRVDPNGENNRNLTNSADVRERRPRIDPTGSVAVYERIEADGKGRIFIFQSTLTQVPVTAGGPGTATLPGTLYVVGADADPDYAPDGRSIVFRRLTGTGNGGLGSWDVLTVRTDGSAQAVVASGPEFRGAPDWGPEGIVYNEVDPIAATSELVVVQPDGTGRRSLLSIPAVLEITNPRWLP